MSSAISRSRGDSAAKRRSVGAGHLRSRHADDDQLVTEVAGRVEVYGDGGAGGLDAASVMSPFNGSERPGSERIDLTACRNL